MKNAIKKGTCRTINDFNTISKLRALSSSRGKNLNDRISVLESKTVGLETKTTISSLNPLSILSKNLPGDFYLDVPGAGSSFVVTPAGEILIIGGYDFQNTQEVNGIFKGTLTDLTKTENWIFETGINLGFTVPQSSESFLGNSKLYSFGGTFQGTGLYSDEIRFVNAATPLALWSISASTLPIPLAASGFCKIGTKLYFFGGVTTGGALVDKILSADANNPEVWTDETALDGNNKLPIAVKNPLVVLDEQYVYLFCSEGYILRASQDEPLSSWENLGNGFGLPSGNLIWAKEQWRAITIGNEIYFFIETENVSSPSGSTIGNVDIFVAPLSNPLALQKIESGYTLNNTIAGSICFFDSSGLNIISANTVNNLNGNNPRLKVIPNDVNFNLFLEQNDFKPDLGTTDNGSMQIISSYQKIGFEPWRTDYI